MHKGLLAETDSLFLTRSQVAALQRADSVFSERVRGVYGELGEFLARGNGGAGKAELDSANAIRKAYWRIFWEQPEIADSIVTATQKELYPILRSMLATTKKDRENSETHFGHRVKMAPARTGAAQGGSAAPPQPRAGP